MDVNIKFRVWSRKEKKWMFSFKELGGLSLIGETVLCGNFSGFSLDRYYEDFVITQFTGMQDQNGNDIYEGDVVSACIDNDGDEEVEGIIKFDNGMFYLLDPNSGRHCLVLEYMEITGNIFENEEFL